MKRKVALSVVALMAVVWSGWVEAEVKVRSVSGVVRVTAPGGLRSTLALPGQILAEGMEITTGQDSRVTIELGSRNIVKLRSNARMVIGTLQPKRSRFRLLAGKLKGLFAGLVRGQRFELEFADSGAVASVKGTEFVAEVTAEGYRINTIFGAIDLMFGGKTYAVPQGCGLNLYGDGSPGTALRVKVQALSEQQIQEGTSRGADRTGRRAALHRFIRANRALAAADRDLVAQMREDDFAVGRTLRDVHGNLVRVDQRLIRPRPNVIQVVNLVKRESYQYGTGKFKYNGYSGPRFDYMEGRLAFNAPLPASVMAWPKFFAAHEGSVRLVSVRMVLANGGPAAVRAGVADSLIHKSEFDVHPGHVTAAGAWHEDHDTFLINGRRANIIEAFDSPERSGEATGDLWALKTEAYKVKSPVGPDQVVLLHFEGYLINNDGKILNAKDFTENKSQDPFSVLRTVAGEVVISAQKPNGELVFGANGTRPSNIDLVVIPDLVVAVVKKYGSLAARGLDDEDKHDSETFGDDNIGSAP